MGGAEPRGYRTDAGEGELLKLDIKSATAVYEKWLSSQTKVVAADLAFKHQRMRESPFVFLRGTFYRWLQQWPDICRSLAGAPRVTAVGDLHVENFGTWRDREGRLIWGINDVDESDVLPYTNDLVRLATSAVLAVREQHLALRLRDICDAIIDGYAASLERGGRPIVLAEHRRWLREIAISDLREPNAFWERMQGLPRARGAVPHDALRALMPGRDVTYTVHRRVAGAGSLGRQRFVAIAEWEGGLIAREARAAAGLKPCATSLVRDAVRAHDPFWAVVGSWIVRRLAPDCSRIEVDDLPKKRDERKLLRAMGWETANLHLASPPRAIVRDLRARRARWLERAASDMMEAVIVDWRAWRGQP